MVAAPQPVVPRRAMFHLPARSALEMLPMLAELVVLRLTMVVKANTPSATRRANTLWFFMTFSLNGLRIACPVDRSIRFARQTSPRGNKSGATWTNAKPAGDGSCGERKVLTGCRAKLFFVVHGS